MTNTDSLFRVAHFADLHVCQKHADQLFHCIDYAFAHAIASKADLAVLAGDTFDGVLAVHDPAFRSFLQRFALLAKNIPVVVLQGTLSHDRAGSIRVLNEIEYTNPVLVVDTPGQYLLLSSGGFQRIDGEAALEDCSALLNILPCEARLRKDTTVDHLRPLCEAWSHNTSLARAKGIPTMLLAHGSVGGCTTESGHGIDNQGADFNVDLFSTCGAHVTLLGDIHKHQYIPYTNGVAAYPGSLARMVHGHNDPTGYLLWAFSEWVGFKSTFIPTPSWPFVALDFPGMPDIEVIRGALFAEHTNVRVRYSVPHKTAHEVDPLLIRRILESKGATVKIEGTVIPLQSVRSSGIASCPTLLEKITQWAITVGATEHVAALHERLRQLQSEDVDSIAASYFHFDDEA